MTDIPEEPVPPEPEPQPKYRDCPECGYVNPIEKPQCRRCRHVFDGSEVVHVAEKNIDLGDTPAPQHDTQTF